MASSITNISDITSKVALEQANELTYTEELQKLNKIKYNLSVLYFAILVVLFGTLLI